MRARNTGVQWAGALVALGFLAAAGTAVAHHGWGSYDADHPVTATGPLMKVTYGNPHVEAVIQSEGKAWTVILAPISRMEARGATADVLKVGETISAYGYPSREHPDEMRAERITIGNKTYELR